MNTRRPGLPSLRPTFHASIHCIVKHGITITGRRFRLRPVELDDAAFIVELRSQPERSRFIHPISPNLADQEAWLERYFDRPSDYYFIIERLENGCPEGTVGLYDQDRAAKSAEWGRWVVRPGSRAGVEGLLLVYRVAFEILGLEMVYSRTVAGNTRALAIHASYGLEPYRVLPGDAVLGDSVHDVVEHRLTRSAWPTLKAALEAQAYGV